MIDDQLVITFAGENVIFFIHFFFPFIFSSLFHECLQMFTAHFKLLFSFSITDFSSIYSFICLSFYCHPFPSSYNSI